MNVSFARWLASAVLFVLMSSGIVSPEQQDEVLQLLEVGISGLCLLIYSIYEVIHLYKKMHQPATIGEKPGILRQLIVKMAEGILEPKKTQ